MKAEYLREPGRTFMVLEGEKPVATESYQIRMLLGNMIPSVMKVRLQLLDGRSRLLYETTSMQNLDELYGGRMFSLCDIRMIIESCLRAAEEMQEYLLDIDQLVLKPEYMYTAAGEKRLYFCCFPEEKREYRLQLRELMEMLLTRLDHSERGAVSAGYMVYRCMNADAFSFDEIRNALYSCGRNGDAGRLPKHGGAVDAGAMADLARAADRDYFPDDGKAADGRNPAGCERDHEEPLLLPEQERKHMIEKPELWITGLVILLAAGAFCVMWYFGVIPPVPQELILAAVTGICGTGMLLCLAVRLLQKRRKSSAGPGLFQEEFHTEISDFPGYEDEDAEDASLTEIIWEPQGDKTKEPILRSSDPRRDDIRLEKSVTVVGKLRSAADTQISCPTVSRIHARLLIRDGECFVTDLNSRNGTYVNDRLLERNEEVMLTEGDKVRFAEAEYCFALL